MKRAWSNKAIDRLRNGAWTTKAIDRMTECYPTMTAAQVAFVLGATPLAVRTQASKQGLHKAHRTWTEGQLAVLRDTYGTRGGMGLAAEIGKSPKAITKMARRLGLTCPTSRPAVPRVVPQTLKPALRRFMLAVALGAEPDTRGLPHMLQGLGLDVARRQATP